MKKVLKKRERKSIDNFLGNGIKQKNNEWGVLLIFKVTKSWSVLGKTREGSLLTRGGVTKQLHSIFRVNWTFFKRVLLLWVFGAVVLLFFLCFVYGVFSYRFHLLLGLVLLPDRSLKLTSIWIDSTNHLPKPFRFCYAKV